ncbi:HlyD family type I secretion periplasmic adaptor subunit [Roseiarcaceae bacterium H3SJ34-1]|uniref:HlyD family type I secretion periplasmic adaptor subunit n=1 Tax=Terripilifer ovatus TaxID=3032367 RepID=UPI003AB97FCA|nr:HlyD family type I secretion periplasmic adaptor subunit [Roseiarcaceae bacterium H3SJ34-1]
MDDRKRRIDRSINLHLRHMAIAGVFLLGGAGIVGATTDLAGAVVAAGSLVVETSIKKIQHPTGGIVGQLFVREGTHVDAGEVMIRLDETLVRANLTTVEKDLWELESRQARLVAERDQADDITFPDEMLAAPADSDIGKIVQGERNLFSFRREAALGQKHQLRQRIVQLNEKIGGLKIQADAKVSEIGLLKQELDGVNELWEKKLVPLTRVVALQRNNARLEGENGQLMSTIAEARGKIAETELQIIQIDQDMRSDVAKQLGDIRAKIAELREKRVAALDQLKRTDIRAPQSGLVHELSVHTEGGVIGAGEQIMLIVPDADKLAVEVRVPPENIDQVHVGQTAVLRFSSFNQRTTPEVQGTVSVVSASTSKDDKAGAGYYSVRITMDPKLLQTLGDVKLVPGMPVDAFLRTSDRTIVSYLMKPLSDQMYRAFRER